MVEVGAAGVGEGEEEGGAGFEGLFEGAEAGGGGVVVEGDGGVVEGYFCGDKVE